MLFFSKVSLTTGKSRSLLTVLCPKLFNISILSVLTGSKNKNWKSFHVFQWICSGEIESCFFSKSFVGFSRKQLDRVDRLWMIWEVLIKLSCFDKYPVFMDVSMTFIQGREGDKKITKTYRKCIYVHFSYFFNELDKIFVGGGVDQVDPLSWVRPCL